MAFLEIKNVSIKGISACVGKEIEYNRDYKGFTQQEAEKFIITTGIEQRRKSGDSICASDLCYRSAEQLIKDLKWRKSEIDCLIFVTQGPDYLVPPTSCILQQRLGLSTECIAIDAPSGCSGWVCGLSILAGLLSSSGLKKGLLLCGDTPSRCCSVFDKSAYPLFSDAGAATALEFCNDSVLKFHVATDGGGFNAIMIPDGGYRNPVKEESLQIKQIEDGIKRNNLQLAINGMDVFSFGISKAPQSVNSLIEHFSLNKEAVEYYVFHQANMFMNENIRKKLKLPKEKVPYSLREFGNTSSASIPLTMITQLKNGLLNSKKEIIACGFGAGLSWGSVHFFTDDIVCSDLIEMN